eukprot:TRINITY_DN27531_c0_g1_i1.p1 TRINITY_DN27531_c0_g1~~TRINITY_DN27531_c0_g1_i1.p1  ORF type:complete len:474 (-),score=67.09 TRINITY_DN27531_c0_g1_i1:137-1558(-)
MVEEHIGRLLRQLKAQQCQIDAIRQEFTALSRAGEKYSEELAALSECLEISGYLQPGQFAAHVHRRRFEGLLRRSQSGCSSSIMDVARVPGVLHPVLRFAGIRAIRSLASVARLLRGCTKMSEQYTARPTRIYVLGGSTSGTQEPLRNVLRFSIGGCWEELPPMPTARDVLAAASHDGVIYAVGGTDGSRPLAVAERLDVEGPGTGGGGGIAWETLEPMPTGRGGLALCAAGGRIYAVGGSDGANALDTVEYYDCFYHCWKSGPSLRTSRRGVALASVEGSWGHCVYAFGGSDGIAALSSVERLVVVGESSPRATAVGLSGSSVYSDCSWETVPPMPTPRRAAAAAVLGGRAFVVGGAGGVTMHDLSITAVECLDLAEHIWEALPAMPSPRRGLSLLAGDRVLYALGGSDGTQASNAFEMYDPEAGQWETMAPMPARRAYFGAATTQTLEVLGLTRGQAAMASALGGGRCMLK